MHDTEFLNCFKKSYKKYSCQSSFDKEKFVEAVELLQQGKRLPQKYNDHQLTGNLRKYREFHLKKDLVVRYYVDKMAGVVVFADIGTHNEALR